MTKVQTLPVTSGGPTRSAGNWIIIDGKFGAYAQKWPRARGKAKTPNDFYKQQEFAIAASWAADAEPGNYESATLLAPGTTMVPRDFLTMAAYGTFLYVRKPDGTMWERYRDVTVNAQLTLDQVTDTVGALIWRSDAGWVQIPPGSNGQLLQVQSNIPDWHDVIPPPTPFDAGSGTTLVPNFADSTIYLCTPTVGGTVLTTFGLSANNIYFIPFVIPWNRTFTSIAISIPTGGNVAGSNARLGLFLLDPPSGGPGVVALDAGNVTTATVGLRAITINQALARGVYFIALWPSAAITVRAAANVGSLANCGFSLGAASPAPCNWLRRTATFGSAFSDESAQAHIINTGTSAIPLVGIR